MIKSELIQKIAEENPHLFQRDVERIVATVFEEVIEAMAAGHRVELRGFGAFSVKKRDSRTGRNPRTGDSVEVEEKYVPFFKTGKALRGAPFAIPSSLKWVRLATSLTADGAATVRVDCLDENSDAAVQSAAVLTAGLEAATTSEVPILGRVRMIDEVVFRAAGDHVQATIKLNPAQTRELAKIVARGSANIGASPTAAPPGSK